MKKEEVHKVVVHNFVNLIEKSQNIDSLSIFLPLFVSIASSFYTLISQSVRQAQWRTKPPCVSDIRLFFELALRSMTIRPFMASLVAWIIRQVQCPSRVCSLLGLYPSTGAVPFFMSAAVCSTPWPCVDCIHLWWSLHSPDRLPWQMLCYHVDNVFREPSFRYLLFMRLFWICLPEATHFSYANVAWCCDSCHYLVRTLRCNQ